MGFKFLVVLVLVASFQYVIAKSVKDADISKIIDSCYDYLESHLCEGEKWGLPFHFYRPSIEKYSADQWLWDSGSHMIVWSQKNVSNAVLDMRTMLQMQQDDGRIPEQIYWSDRSPKEDAELLLMYSNTKFTGKFLVFWCKLDHWIYWNSINEMLQVDLYISHVVLFSPPFPTSI